MSNTIQLPHTCPNCIELSVTIEDYIIITATTEAEARDKFGFRTMTNPDGSKYIRIQSWCKNCR